MIVVNLFAGPGTGKSSTAAGVFSFLKGEGINCELVTEEAKNLIWNGSFDALKYVPLVFGIQGWKLERLKDKVDVIVTDCPLFLFMAYSENMPKCFHDFILYEHNRYNNLNFFLNRNENNAFEQVGRIHSLEESKKIDDKIKTLFVRYDIDFEEISMNKATNWIITNKVLDIIKSNKNYL